MLQIEQIIYLLLYCKQEKALFSIIWLLANIKHQMEKYMDTEYMIG